MRLYDLVVVFRSTLTDKEREKLLAKIKGWLKDAKVLKEENWGQKPLAYKIKKEVSGVYHKFEIEAEKVMDELDKNLKSDEAVLRHLLLRKK